MTQPFAGKAALVTGGNSGIGRAIVHALAGAGAAVVLVGRDPEKGATVEREVREHGGSARFYSVELGDASAVEALMAEVAQLHPALRVLVNCAGGGDRKM
jgi:NAD(P)-dependent dehydrogenase (short-subunit alcohol dehydrogenase family)